MGCEKSLPLVPTKPNPISAETLLRRSTFKKAKTRLITSQSCSITESFKILKALSTNISSTVLFAEDIQTGEYRAIREISKSVWRENKRFFREVDILKDFDHPNIVKVFGTIETPLNFYNIFEYLDGGDLKDLVRGIRNETALSRYIRDIVSALNYIHKQGFAHCNLSPSSILVTNDEEAVAKLTGLDFAQDLNEIEQPDYENMKLIYASPEFLKKEFEEKTDIWSLGVVVYELLVGKHPCCGRDTKEVLTEVVRGNIDFESTSFRTLSFNAQDFIKCTLQVDVMKRMSAFEALNHPWLAFSGKEHIINYDALMRLLTFKIKSNITRKVLQYFSEKIEIKPHEIIKTFKNIDGDFDGFITKEEVVEAFQIVGIDASGEINGIMSNIDIDSSGFLDFTEIKIALTKWDQMIKVKTLKKIFKNENEMIQLQSLKHLFPEILPHEWNEFSWKVKAENGMVLLARMKEYLRANIE